MTREERVVLEAYRRVAPVVREAGGAVIMLFPEAPDSPMLNRAVGLGVDAPAAEADVDAVLEAFGEGVTFYVTVSPTSQPPELPRWLASRGLEPGWGWMTFARGVDVPERRPTALELRAVETDVHAAAFARIVPTGYGLPGALEPTIARTPAAGWRCWLAVDGEEPASAAAMYVGEASHASGSQRRAPSIAARGLRTRCSPSASSRRRRSAATS